MRVRVTLELEREADFHEERLEARRACSSTCGTRARWTRSRTRRFAFDDDVVRQARIGRQPDNRTRVVLDLQGAARYSVYSLYNPYRIVIDFERRRSRRRSTARSRRPAAPADAGARLTARSRRHRRRQSAATNSARRVLALPPARPRHLAHRHRPGAWRPRPGRAGARTQRSRARPRHRPAAGTAARQGTRRGSRPHPPRPTPTSRSKNAPPSPTAPAPICFSRSTPTPARNAGGPRVRNLLPQLRAEPGGRSDRRARERRLGARRCAACPTSSRPSP